VLLSTKNDWPRAKATIGFHFFKFFFGVGGGEEAKA